MGYVCTNRCTRRNMGCQPDAIDALDAHAEGSPQALALCVRRSMLSSSCKLWAVGWDQMGWDGGSSPVDRGPGVPARQAAGSCLGSDSPGSASLLVARRAEQRAVDAGTGTRLHGYFSVVWSGTYRRHYVHPPRLRDAE